MDHKDSSLTEESETAATTQRPCKICTHVTQRFRSSLTAMVGGSAEEICLRMPFSCLAKTSNCVLDSSGGCLKRWSSAALDDVVRIKACNHTYL